MANQDDKDNRYDKDVLNHIIDIKEDVGALRAEVRALIDIPQRVSALETDVAKIKGGWKVVAIISSFITTVVVGFFAQIWFNGHK